MRKWQECFYTDKSKEINLQNNNVNHAYMMPNFEQKFSKTGGSVCKSTQRSQ